MSNSVHPNDGPRMLPAKRRVLALSALLLGVVAVAILVSVARSSSSPNETFVDEVRGKIRFTAATSDRDLAKLGRAVCDDLDQKYTTAPEVVYNIERSVGVAGSKARAFVRALQRTRSAQSALANWTTSGQLTSAEPASRRPTRRFASGAAPLDCQV